ncbi:Gfo/Idh/MocA family oxidoreductase [Nesterenkonia sp. HG001]|uniref:Gfo/Idh/MocA family oxidoreductase n=1 Tax=Nesterenkonia sp. HG001 TaxID=2983207 RepID=UPI002AC678D8|nr:Gfo/Idh/MocA family oxidoreductase [Nesterenkonia sp. HG001]MDZ5078188.1 Gfo/Idh/MocA family oxidoreductase [Nesterenkonia sp. HG001]
MSIPLILVGAGGMGRAWLQTIEAEPRAELAGVVDLDLDAARAALAEAGRTDVPVGSDAVALAQETGAQAVVNVTVPRAHHPVTTSALFAGLPVLSEKPVADTLPRALSLAAAAEVTGQLFMVSQSRRYNPQLFSLRAQAEGLGAAGALVTEFFKAPRFGGFRERMLHPLLLDMAIHPFDTARFLLGAEPVSVYCEEFNPPWSWYDGDAAATAIFEMDGGARFVYTGSWCSPGQETSWNGSWRLSAERGTVTWDGDHEPVVEAPDAGVAEKGVLEATVLDEGGTVPGEGIAGALAEFLDALAAGAGAAPGRSEGAGVVTPMGEVHENIMSLAMVEAAVESASRGGRVRVDEILENAWRQALAGESRDEVRERLVAWPSVRGALTAGARV